jgi:uncharacterized membrane protein YoaT (DUF817 family)
MVLAVVRRSTLWFSTLAGIKKMGDVVDIFFYLNHDSKPSPSRVFIVCKFSLFLFWVNLMVWNWARQCITKTMKLPLYLDFMLHIIHSTNSKTGQDFAFRVVDSATDLFTELYGMLSFIHFTQFSCIRIFQGHSRAWATP